MSPFKFLTVFVLIALSFPGPQNKALAGGTSRRLLTPTIPQIPWIPNFPGIPGGIPNYPGFPGSSPNYGNPRDFPGIPTGGIPNLPGFPGGFPGSTYPGNFPGGQPNDPNAPILPPPEITKTSP
ncbi:translation initiation factor IF-2 [Striga asiatica]|uniref:Translation initiation factor IF-2 n=1 Tax=Striga asiatica TaxID=4170 RepID=A0A5A7PU73_STRAF|nr:translation initiation factor IF-2 [Striga asiatica]